MRNYYSRQYRRLKNRRRREGSSAVDHSASFGQNPKQNKFVVFRTSNCLGKRRRTPTKGSLMLQVLFCYSLIAFSNHTIQAFAPINANAFYPKTSNVPSSALLFLNYGRRRDRVTRCPQKGRNHAQSCSRTTTSIAVFVDTISAETTASALAVAANAEPPLQALADYAPAAASLFNNMKLPAAVVTAGMISLGFATTFPELPRETPENRHIFTPDMRQRCDALNRLHVVVALIAVTSELIVVMWAAVEVNQLTEKQYALASSVWDLIQRDADLAWSAVNSHFVLGIIGFVAMLTLRAYVMLVKAEASKELMTAASTGIGAALCLMISIVNRGVESGGGNGERYGSTILDLFQHYVFLLAQTATNDLSPGPLQLAALILEITSLVFMANVFLFQNGKAKYLEPGIDSDRDYSVVNEDEECPVIDLLELEPEFLANGDAGDTNSVVLLLEKNGSKNGNKENQRRNSKPIVATSSTKEERQKIASCLVMEDEEEDQKLQEEEERRREHDSDNSVNIL